MTSSSRGAVRLLDLDLDLGVVGLSSTSRSVRLGEPRTLRELDTVPSRGDIYEIQDETDFLDLHQ